MARDLKRLKSFDFFPSRLGFNERLRPYTDSPAVWGHCGGADSLRPHSSFSDPKLLQAHIHFVILSHTLWASLLRNTFGKDQRRTCPPGNLTFCNLGVGTAHVLRRRSPLGNSSCCNRRNIRTLTAQVFCHQTAWRVLPLALRNESPCVDHVVRWLGSDFLDTFAECHQKAEQRFTYWTQLANMRYCNKGSRLDYILCDKKMP